MSSHFCIAGLLRRLQTDKQALGQIWAFHGPRGVRIFDIRCGVLSFMHGSCEPYDALMLKSDRMNLCASEMFQATATNVYIGGTPALPGSRCTPRAHEIARLLDSGSQKGF